MRLSYMVFIAGLSAFIACRKMLPEMPSATEVLAKPVKGLTPTQLALHLEGDKQFSKIFSEADGLGPVYIHTSCENCHAGDGKGNPNHNLTRFGKYGEDGTTWDPMISLGGPQLQHRAISNYQPELLPAAVKFTKLIAPSASGMGFLEAVEDRLLLDLADLQQKEGIVSGVPQMVLPTAFFNPRYHHKNINGKYIGRFGRKASAIDLLQQTVAAYKNDIGITSDFDLADPVNHAVSPLAGDNVSDPEINSAIVTSVVFYLQTLQPPPRQNPENPAVNAGEIIFRQLGCNKCHVETLRTGKSAVTALNSVDFHPYTDLLLHDMGPELDEGYTENNAKTSEWRTAPLWGLGLQSQSQGGRVFLLHDGRASSYDEAIKFHGGEAGFSRTNYNNLSEEEKNQLLIFLNSL